MAKKKGPYVEIIGKWKHECVSPSRRYDTNLETGLILWKMQNLPKKTNKQMNNLVTILNILALV